MFYCLFRRTGLVTACLSGAMLCTRALPAQTSELEPLDPEPVEIVDSSVIPLDDITYRAVVKEKVPLAYAPVREADILWERRIWRVIDVREKMNQPFMAPESPLFSVLLEAALKGEIPVYSTENDRFTKPLRLHEISAMVSSTDTIMTLEGDDFTIEKVKIVVNEMNWEDVKRFRVKEVWYFDSNTSSLKVRILGIAPLVDVRDENGDFKFEKPLFWVHYPTARKLLAQHKVMEHQGNYASNTTWEDLFEARRFASAIYKQNNTLDLRIQDYKTGIDMLHEGKKIESELFAREHDLWSW
jgi:gliding motility associated protien GldN